MTEHDERGTTKATPPQGTATTIGPIDEVELKGWLAGLPKEVLAVVAPLHPVTDGERGIEASNAMTKALVAAKAEIKTLPKDQKVSYQSKRTSDRVEYEFASLAAIHEEIDEKLCKQGLIVLAPINPLVVSVVGNPESVHCRPECPVSLVRSRPAIPGWSRAVHCRRSVRVSVRVSTAGLAFRPGTCYGFAVRRRGGSPNSERAEVTMSESRRCPVSGGTIWHSDSIFCAGNDAIAKKVINGLLAGEGSRLHAAAMSSLRRWARPAVAHKAAEIARRRGWVPVRAPKEVMRLAVRALSMGAEKG